MAQAITRNVELEQSNPCGPDTLIDGRYRVIGLVGEGMSSLVYRARHEALDREVAVKVLHLNRSHDPIFVSRFRTEARVASAISDRHTAAIYDFGEHDGSLYLVMELVTGIPLGQELDRGPASAARVRTVMGQILDGLTAIHRAGVTHADLKPDNVILSRSEHGSERVVLIDFGIARVQPRDEDSVGRRVTKEQLVAGTPGYIAPEVIGGATPTPAADLYAAGVILFELLTGTQPYSAENGLEVMRRHVCEPLPLPSSIRAELPAECDAVCRRALAKTPEERYSSASEFRDALEAALHGAVLEGAAREIASDTDDARPTWDVVPSVERALTALPFVGRRAELRSLVELFEGTGPHAALRLTGVAGSGRTTLVARAVEQAGASGPCVVIAGADPTGARSLYAPVRELLARLFGLPAGCPAEHLLTAIMAAQGHVPELAGVIELVHGCGALDALTAAERRELVMFSVVAIVERVVDGRTTLVFDDTQAYDAASCEIVAALAGRVPTVGGRVLIIGEPEDELMARLPQLSLAPLTENEISTMAEAIGGFVQATPSIDSLLQLCQGNPGHLEQLSRYLIEQPQQSHPPSTFADLTRCRLEALPRAAVRLIQALAVLGHAAPREHLAALALTAGVGSAADAVEGALGQAVRHCILAIDGGRVRFACSRVRDAVYAGIPAPFRLGLHRAALDQIRAEGSAVVCAWHALESGEIDAAARHLCEAGAQATRFGEGGAALEIYRTAFGAATEAWRKDPSPSRGARMERAGLGLAGAYLDHGRAEPAATVLGTVCQHDGLERHPHVWSTDLIEAWARLAFLRGDGADAIRALREQLRESALLIPPSVFVSWALRIGEFLAALAGPEAGARALRAAARELEASHEGWGASWRLHLGASEYGAAAGDLRGAVESAVSACADAAGGGEASALWRTSMALAAAVEASGDETAALPHRRRAERALVSILDERDVGRAATHSGA